MANNDISLFKDLTKEQILIIVEREKSKRSFYNFFMYCINNIYKHIEFNNNWHYKVICDTLQAEVERMLRREPTNKHLLINLPIRAGKTILISEIFPVWVWIQSDTLMIQNVCATQRLATKSSRMSKLIITSEWFQARFPEIELSIDNKSKSDYSTKNNGVRVSYGIDSSIIGSSYDILIVDDPNDPKDNNSDTALRNVVDTFKDVIVGRMNNDWGLRVILQQRTSSKDLCQHLLDENKSDYRHICLPVEITKDVSPEFRDYYVDGLFFPKRYSRKRLEQYSRELSGQAYASQLLQAPSSLEGEILLRSWFKVIKQSEFQKLNKGKVYLFIDTAYTKNIKDNDPSGYYICCVVNGRIYVIKAYEKWLEFHENMEEIIEIINTYNVKRVYIENKATGISVSQELKRQLRGKCLVLGINPGSKSKIERARAIQTYLVNERVIIVEDIWNESFMSQLANFPYGKHDSHIDNLSYSVLTLIAGKKLPTEEGNNDKGMAVETDDFRDHLYD